MKKILFGMFYGEYKLVKQEKIETFSSSDKQIIIISSINWPGSRPISDKGRDQTALTIYSSVDNCSDIYRVDKHWARDEYITLDDYIIPKKEFGHIGEGGCYVIGDNFILCSTKHEDFLKDKLDSYPHLKKAFESRDLLFMKPYVEPDIEGGRKLEHLDLTINYVNSIDALVVMDLHYEQQKNFVDSLISMYGMDLIITKDSRLKEAIYSPNFFELENGIVVAHKKSDLHRQLRSRGVKTVAPHTNLVDTITWGGSIHCITNVVPSLKLLDEIDILYWKYC